MSIDLDELFGEAGFDGPSQRLDCDYIVSRGRRARARRRVGAGATAVVGTAAVVLGAATLAANTGAPTTPGSATTGALGSAGSSTPTSEAATPSVSSQQIAVSPVVTVTPAEKVDLGAGSYLTVTSSEKCVMAVDPPDPAPLRCKSIDDGNQAAGSVSVQATRGSGSQGRYFITGIYTGTDATRITVTLDGKSETATIVKLGSQPRALAYFLVWPTPTPSGSDLKVEAFDAEGTLLSAA